MQFKSNLKHKKTKDKKTQVKSKLKRKLNENMPRPRTAIAF